MDGSGDLWEALFGTREATATGPRTDAGATPASGLSRISLEGLDPAERRSVFSTMQRFGLVAPTAGEPSAVATLVRPLTAADVSLLEIFGFHLQLEAPTPAEPPAGPLAEPSAKPLAAPGRARPPLPRDTEPPRSHDTAPIIDAEWRPATNTETTGVQRIIDPGPLPVHASAAPSNKLVHPAASPPAPPAASPPARREELSSSGAKWAAALGFGTLVGAAGAVYLALRTSKRADALDDEVSRLRSENRAIQRSVGAIERTLQAYPTDDTGVAEAVDRELAALDEQRAAYQRKSGTKR